MANDLSANPYVIDTAGATSLVSGYTYIRLIQWIDDNADIADNDDLVFELNGQTVTIKVQRGGTPDYGVVVYEAGPFNPPISAENFQVTTIDHGTLLVFVN